MYNEDTVHPKVIKQINYLKFLKKKRWKRNREGWLSWSNYGRHPFHLAVPGCHLLCGFVCPLLRMRKLYLQRRYTSSSKLGCGSSSGTCILIIRPCIPTCPKRGYLSPLCFPYAISVWGISLSSWVKSSLTIWAPIKGFLYIPLLWSCTDFHNLILMSTGLVFSTIFKEGKHLLTFRIPWTVQFIMNCR